MYLKHLLLNILKRKEFLLFKEINSNEVKKTTPNTPKRNLFSGKKSINKNKVGIIQLKNLKIDPDNLKLFLKKIKIKDPDAISQNLKGIR